MSETCKDCNFFRAAEKTLVAGGPSNWPSDGCTFFPMQPISVMIPNPMNGTVSSTIAMVPHGPLPDGKCGQFKAKIRVAK